MGVIVESEWFSGTRDRHWCGVLNPITNCENCWGWSIQDMDARFNVCLNHFRGRRDSGLSESSERVHKTNEFEGSRVLSMCLLNNPKCVVVQKSGSSRLAPRYSLLPMAVKTAHRVCKALSSKFMMLSTFFLLCFFFHDIFH